MYRSKELRQYQYYVNPDWAGMHADPTFVPAYPDITCKAVFMVALGLLALGR